MRPVILRLLGVIAVMVLVLAGPPAVRAVTIAVTTTADEVGVNGECSLREAVLAANTNVAVDTCPAGSSGEADNIALPSGRYELSIPGAGEDAGATGDLDLLGSTIIRGDELATNSPNATVIDGAGLDRVFDAHGASTRVAFHSLVISGGATGDDGGGIRLATDAPAGQSCMDGPRASLFRAVVRDNSAARGGGVFIGGCVILEVEVTSVVDNVAIGDGGGLASEALASVVIATSTLSHNAAGGAGGGLWIANSVTGGLYWSTVADNSAATGGGISSEPSSGTGFTLISTILAHNAGGSCDLAPGSVTVTYTLSTDGTCGSPGDGNLPSTDPLLLARDEDPVAYRLQPESPAIDAGDPRVPCTPLLETDQYGTVRPVDGDGDGVAVCDIGSYEAPEPDPTGSESPAGGGLPNTAVTVAQSASDTTTSVTLTLGAAILLLVAGARYYRCLRRRPAGVGLARSRSVRRGGGT